MDRGGKEWRERDSDESMTYLNITYYEALV